MVKLGFGDGEGLVFLGSGKFRAVDLVIEAVRSSGVITVRWRIKETAGETDFAEELVAGGEIKFEVWSTLVKMFDGYKRSFCKFFET